MADTYRDAILDTAAGLTPPWRIQWPPTGSGKTLGAKAYAVLQAEQNGPAGDPRKPVGILIVTRLIAQADEMVNAINTLSIASSGWSRSGSRPFPKEFHLASDTVARGLGSFTDRSVASWRN